VKNVNIKDVAKKAGVAVSTVSRVLNDHSDVKKETKEHVLNVIKELNYIPNNSARNLKRSSSNSIGVFVLGEYNPFFGEIVEYLESEISLRGYSVMIHFHHNNRNDLETASQFILEKKLLGLIYLGGSVSKDKEGYLAQMEAPVVFTSTVVEEGVNPELFSSVRISEEGAVRNILNHVLSLGHKRIGIITAETEGLCASPERFSVYKKILQENNLVFKNEYLECGDYSIKSGYDSMKKLLGKQLGLTAVFAVNDLMAIGAIKAITDSGLCVPDDISVVGFDGLDYGQYYSPGLTTIKQPISNFGKNTAQIICDLIDGKSEQSHIVLDTELIVRESCKGI